MTDIAKSYVTNLCALAGESDPSEGVSLFAVGGKVLVFDSPVHAQDFMQRFACDRLPSWSADMETCWYTPWLADHVNKLVLIRDYDPYNLPACHPVQSETHLKSWKYHITLWDAKRLYQSMKDGTEFRN